MTTSHTPEAVSQVSLNASKNASTRFPLIFKTVWQRLFVWLASGHELRVWKTSDRNGETGWHAYDPTTGRSICVASDAEMREWIERRYY
ncbi:hypothetical protein [Microcoleus sp. FACHB-68]|uniref:hypothetical protein n=1 Tax=Microcoleus sp. FACHB-68 TaxID=2692826 RepID=UPI0018EF8DB5|nr:hypothetical protein [Microcoleus sp. FACHB-68]